MESSSKEKSPWNEVLGPFYADDGLQRRGLDPVGDKVLIKLETTDGVTVYPTRQFIEVDGILETNPNVEQAWLLLRDCSSGVWTAASFLFSPEVYEDNEAPTLLERLITSEPGSDDAKLALIRVKRFVSGLEQ